MIKSQPDNTIFNINKVNEVFALIYLINVLTDFEILATTYAEDTKILTIHDHPRHASLNQQNH